MSKKIKVLHIIDNFGVGGAETWLLAAVKYIHANPILNMHFDFIASGGSESVYDREVKELGSNIFYIKYSYRNFLKFRKQFKDILRAGQYDVIHDHQDFIAGWHFFLGRGALPAMKITHLHNSYSFVHNYVVNPLRWFSFRMGRLLTVALTTKITSTSFAVMTPYGYYKWPYNKKRINPVYCGFDINDFQYRETSKKIFCSSMGWNDNKTKIALFIGRVGLAENNIMSNQKNPEFAFSVAKELVSANTGWKFLFAGYKGKLGEDMEAEIKSLGMENHIKFLGLRNDIPVIMSASDILVFPSLYEGLGMVAVEAQCSGLPVIMSYHVPAEAVVCGELITVKSLKDGYNDWVKKIVEIANRQYNRSEYAEKLRNSAFSIENSVKRLINIYTNKDAPPLHWPL